MNDWYRDKMRACDTAFEEYKRLSTEMEKYRESCLHLKVAGRVTTGGGEYSPAWKTLHYTCRDCGYSWSQGVEVDDDD